MSSSQDLLYFILREKRPTCVEGLKREREEANGGKQYGGREGRGNEGKGKKQG